MASSSTLTIDILHRYVDILASHDPQSPGIIGPCPVTSIFLGHKYIATGDGPALPIIVRCVWPPNTASRHAVIRMKPSVPEQALAAKLCETFEIPTTGGVITNTGFSWISGLCPFEDTTDPLDPATATSKRRPAKLTRRPEFAECIERLGAGKGGIIELVVKSPQQFAVCSRCRNYQGTADAAMLQRVRDWCLDVQSLCPGCMVSGGIPRDIREVILPGGIHAMRI